MKIDEQKIVDVIAALPATIPPAAKEAGAYLLDGWIKRFLAEDNKARVIAVECGFHVWLSPDTLIVGMQDALFEDKDGIYGGEWKSHKAPRIKLNGEPYKGDTEDDWLEEITSGPQLAIYALALHAGLYYEAGNPSPFRLAVGQPRIQVRAALKTDPPTFWPTKTSGIYTFTPEYLDAVENGLLSVANQIRGARLHWDVVPWQLPGRQCHDWGRDCQFLKACLEHRYPIGGEMGIFNPNDPACEGALKFADPEALKNPRLVVLSASSFVLWHDCQEKFRQISYHGGDKDESINLAIGIVLHAGLAEFYRQMQSLKTAPPPEKTA